MIEKSKFIDEANQDGSPTTTEPKPQTEKNGSSIQIEEPNKDDAKKFVIKKQYIALGILVLFLVVWGIISATGTDELHDALTAQVRRGDLLVTVSETGELIAQDQATIGAITDKQILYLAPEGALVEAGDTVVVFESEKYAISTAEANSSVKVAEADYQKALNDLEAQKAKEEAAKKNYETLPELAKKGFVVESEVEQARLEYMQMQATTRSLESVVQARLADVERSKNAYRNQERKLKQSAMLAPREGVVVYATMGTGAAARKVEVGMVPFEGMDLLYLPDVASMQVRSEFNEVDLDKIRKGQPVEIYIDAYPDTVFAGRVTSIGTLARRKVNPATGKPTGTKVFDLTVQVEAKDARLKPGLSANLNIIVSKDSDVLYVPIESVFTTDNNRSYVFLKKDDDIERRAVELGKSNDLYVEVKNGLDENDIVLLDPPERFRKE